MKKSIALVAMCATALSPVLSTAAYADVIPVPPAAGPSAETLDAMADACALTAASYDTGNGDRWTGSVVPGGATQVGTTDELDEVAGSREIDVATIAHAGDYVPSTLEIRGDPFRIGGSVNMFGEQWSTAGYWTDSTYTFTADYTSTFSYAFTCDVSQEVYHPEEFVEGHPLQGYYIPESTDQGNEEAKQQSCNAFTALGPTWTHWGEDQGQCVFVMTAEATEDSYTPEYFDAPVLFASLPGTPIEQDQVDTLTAFEDHGGPVEVTGEYYVGHTVVCISPSTTTKKGVPGAWVLKNGYTGDKCTTAWFTVAPWGAGTSTSQGTYISVPDYQLMP